MERIRYLLNRRLTRSLTAAEKQELALMLQNEAHNEAVREQLFQLMQELSPDEHLSASRWDNHITAILEADKSHRILRDRSFFKRYWWAAAAFIILLSGMACWRWLLPEKKPVMAGQQAGYDVLPGGNRATLTLAGGRQIVLNDAANGNIATQGNAHIVKLNDGRLVYNLQGRANEVFMNTLTTPVGGQYQLTLPDGTKVWLNAASSITYPSAFNEHERTVAITGEAYFEVNHQAAKAPVPFIVSVMQNGSRGAKVEVLGTHFNINAYSDEEAIKTTLLQGKVKVVNGEWSMVNGQSVMVRPEGSVMLKPGEQAIAAINSPLTIDHSPDLEQAVAWKNGHFNFNGADLPAIMRQLARWYGINVRYTGKITGEVFEGELTRDLSLVQVIRILEKMEIKCRLEDKTLIVTP